jgi:hypothetical protein
MKCSYLSHDIGCIVLRLQRQRMFWFRHCATSRKAAGSIPGGVIEIFHWHNPSGPGVDTASTRNANQEYFLGGKGDRCVGLTTLPPSGADWLQIWKPHHSGPSGPVQVSNGIDLPLT